MRVQRFAAWGLLAFLLFGLTPGSRAGELVREAFEEVPAAAASGVVEGRDGLGWTQPYRDWKVAGPSYIEHSVAASGARQGSISFDLQRKPGVFERDRSVFALIGSQGETLMLMQLRWETSPDDNRPMVHLRGLPFNRMGGSWWSPWVRLDRDVAPGEWVRLELTWDDDRKRYGLLVDGRPQDVTPKWFSSDGEILPDARIEVAETFRRDGKPSPYRPAPFSALLARAAKVRLGINVVPNDPGFGTSPLANAVMDNFAVQTGVSEILSIEHDAARAAGFSGTLVAGDAVAVTLKGAPGAEATFDVARLANRRGEIDLSWKGWGVHLEEKTFFDDDEIDLRDVKEYRVYASAQPIDVGAITEDTPFVDDLDVEVQSYLLDEAAVLLNGGTDTSLEPLLPDTPYYVAVVALMDDETLLPIVRPRQGLAMTGLEGEPGTYEGSFTVGYEDRRAEMLIVGHLRSGEAAAVLAADESFEIDARLKIEVVPSEGELKADEKSTSEITVTVTDANGDAVEDHEVRFVLATTSQYTGVIGGGAFTEEVGGALERDFWGETDMFGRVTATYTAGFAAKTAIIVARDMVSNDVGTGYVKTYINATAQLELEAPQQAAGKALGYTITVTSSDEWLTADGDSEARITAFVALDGIPVEGHRVGFTVAGGSGRIRTVGGETDANGKARAVYTAGTKIGIVLIRATDHTAGISGTVQIELRSDAPAKIAITVDPEVLPADGRSTADVAVVVTDINDNPNEGVEVEYAVSIGSGSLRRVDEITDHRGESSAQYVAGRIPGRVSIEVTVRSTVPTEEELLAAGDLALVVTDYDFF